LSPLKSRVVVITGSSRGIGRAIAGACARAGARVVISSRKTEGVALAVAELRASQLEAAGLAADAASPDDLRRLMDFAIKNYGAIDVWINNAGISSGYRSLQYMSPLEIKEVVDINLLGVLNSCRLLIPYFRERGGIILNLAGRGGKGNPAPYQTTYAATKAAVVSLTRSLAAENKCYKISINCIAPGMVDTDIFKDIATCPETESRLALMPVLLKAFASPMPDVERLAVKLCAQEPGKHTGMCYSAEKWTRYLRALAAVPEFIRVTRQVRRAKRL